MWKIEHHLDQISNFRKQQVWFSVWLAFSSWERTDRSDTQKKEHNERQGRMDTMTGSKTNWRVLKGLCLVSKHSFYSAPSDQNESACLQLQTVQGPNRTFSIYKMVHLYTGNFDVPWPQLVREARTFIPRARFRTVLLTFFSTNLRFFLN